MAGAGRAAAWDPSGGAAWPAAAAGFAPGASAPASWGPASARWGSLLPGAAGEEARYRSLVETISRGPPRGSYSWAPSDPFARSLPPGADLSQATQYAMLEALGRLAEEQSTGGTAGAGKAFRKLHQLQDRTRQRPKEVVADYLSEVIHALSVQPGDAWALSDYTEKIVWGKFRGMHRVHHHCSNILELMLKGEHDRAAGYLTQLCRALHQTAIDGGAWHTASHMLPVSDPLDRVNFAGTHQELEVIASYQEALRRLKKGTTVDDKDKPDGKGQGKSSEKSGGEKGKKNQGEKDGGGF